ncbi:MAG: bifunctional demethylmenaquinone methyltransferase/2-methoxy-6-polyprenyl-1,4-benzoquinol methylase UbiE [Desulfobacterales bacterium]|nr:bifunctional demethylmenaquinone methyltransferase/2-methoxy-6-polyprenyl-1,4-benzoquinol methylase UbiE [Desulfobacterales bacterium]
MELGFIKDMFNHIAPRYDFLNRLLSLRRDVYWRREMVQALSIPEGGYILDAACGTGDVLIELARQSKTGRRMVGIDFAPQMLAVARRKIGPLPENAQTSLVAGNTLALPFLPGIFDAVTIAFGIRNIMDRKAALRQFHEHLKPGGQLAVLELATPRQRLLKTIYATYFERILPAVGGFFTSNRMAYRYLPASVLRFPEPEVFAGLMRSAGFREIRWRRLTMGLATLHVGVKPTKLNK